MKEYSQAEKDSIYTYTYTWYMCICSAYAQQDKLGELDEASSLASGVALGWFPEVPCSD